MPTSGPIIQVVQRLAPGGIEALVLEFERLCQPDQPVLVVSLEGTHEALVRSWPRSASLGDRLIALEKRPGFQPQVFLDLVRLFRRVRPVAVQTHHVGPLLYGGLAARLAGIDRVVHTEHDAWHLSVRKRRAVVRGALAAVRPHLIACGSQVAAAVRRALPGTNAEVIANGVDLDRFRPDDRTANRRRLGLPLGVQLIGSAGRLEPVKGHDVLISALSQLPSSVHLALAGNGSQRSELEDQVQMSGLHDRVHFLGMLDDMVGFYRALDVFCLPSRNEGLPLSLLEAQASGIPAVASDVGGVREAACPRTARLVPADRPGLLADALQTVLTRPAPVSPRRFVKDNFDLADTIGAYRALLVA